MFSVPITTAVFFSAIVSILGDRPNNRILHYIFKPLTMVLLIGWSLYEGIAGTHFAYAILIGLCLSLLGDIFLMLPSDRFVEGLASFLLAHIAYLYGFYQLFEPNVTLWWLAGLLLFSAVFYQLLAKHLGQLKVAVIGYIGVIITMVWMAGELYIQSPSQLHLMLMSAAIIFACSDSALALNKFKQPFKGAQWVILITYFTAQWLFAQTALVA